ncbi:uncharacterized protein LOC127729517 [Mytilus californianus]|uniref:uncharacterized protein LOC127729517 n=1 Tax=Mytilus californianus TaxID=6549 RepID=UPI0022454613|nr:uncharacterized protein LOC127729517 [Mytilus californianus]
MASNILVFIFVLFIQKLARSLTMDTLNACLVNLKGKYQCCADYEERNDACFACKTGFYSRMGQPCNSCPENFFGKACVLECNCDSLQRCDNIIGCISRQTTTLSTEHHYSVNTIEATTIEKEFEEDEKGISKRDLFIYSGSVTGIIVIIGLYCCYNKNRRKTVITSTSAIINDTPPAENDGFRNETFELNENVYHTIDENNMVNLGPHENPYLEVVDESPSSDKLTSSSESMKSSNSSTSGYLHPYHSFIATSNDHPYYQTQPVKEANDPTTTNITDDQYQECVTPLEKMTDIVNHSQGTTNQVIKVIVHKGERSCLDSEKDETISSHNKEEIVNSEH